MEFGDLEVGGILLISLVFEIVFSLALLFSPDQYAVWLLVFKGGRVPRRCGGRQHGTQHLMMVRVENHIKSSSRQIELYCKTYNVCWNCASPRY